MNNQPINQLPFFFVLGVGRSGTTLLQNILDAHKNTRVPIESQLIIHLYKKYQHKKISTSGETEAFLEDLWTDKKFSTTWHIDRTELKKRISALPLEERTLPTLIKQIYLCYTSPYPKEEIQLIGDKNPPNCIFVNELLALFPNAKFIHIIRDYRDNTVSNLTNFSYRSLATVGHAWLSYNLAIEASKQKNPKQFFTIRYEDLSTAPAEKTKEICDFLGLTYNDELIRFHEYLNKQKALTASVDEMHKNLLQPISNAQTNKWKSKLKEKEIIVLDWICGNYAQRYGYLPSSNPEERSIAVRLHALIGKIRNEFDQLIIRTYYTGPLFIRTSASFLSKKMYSWFNVKNYYNQTDFTENKERK